MHKFLAMLLLAGVFLFANPVLSDAVILQSSVPDVRAGTKFKTGEIITIPKNQDVLLLDDGGNVRRVAGPKNYRIDTVELK